MEWRRDALLLQVREHLCAAGCRRLVGARKGRLAGVIARRIGGAARRVGGFDVAGDGPRARPADGACAAVVRAGAALAEDLELGEDKRAVVYYVALLAWLGCHADAHEQSALFGDDIELRSDRHLEDVVGMQ